MKSFLKTPTDKVRIEQVNILFRQSPFLFFGLLSAIIIVGVYFWEMVDRQGLIIWLSANLLLLFGRVVMIKRYHRVRPEETAVRWGYLFTFTSFISGIFWACFAVFLLDMQDLSGVFLFTTIITGMVAGSLVPMSVFIPAHLLFSSLTLMPLAVVTLLDGRPVMVSIGIILFIYLLVMLAYSLIVNDNVTRSIQLRFENLDLLEDLELQKNIAEKASTDKSRFLAATSHDLRQPLHAMDLYLGALKNLLTEKEQFELLDKGLQSSAALSELLSALMDVSRLDAGDVVIDRGVVNVDDLLQAICDEYQERAKQQGITLECQPSKLLVDSDELMLGRMLRNLVNNACIHSAGSRIILSAEKSDEQVQLSVCDDGVGIAEPQQQQVFSEFYQLNNPERDRNKGLGLGLAIVKRLAGLLQHELQLESVAGKGCCFKLYLPFVDMAENLAMDAEAAVDFDVSGLFIILVDDEADIRSAMRTLLLQWGCELLVADSLQSLQQELDKLQYPKPDVLLCDYRLRESQTGLEVVAALREYFKTELPALVISGDTDKAIEQKVVEQGCEILHKPVRPEVLREAVYNLAGLRVADT